MFPPPDSPCDPEPDPAAVSLAERGAAGDADLAAALDAQLAPIAPARLAPVVARLITDYRSGQVPTAPILRRAEDAAAYAAYRMPATTAALRAALSATRGRVPDPVSQLDVGGGTGAAVWAAAQVWPSLHTVTVLEGAEPAIALGQRLAARAGTVAVRRAGWQRRVFTATADLTLPAVDLVTVGYLLGELDPDLRDRLVDAAAARASTVVVVEPGTPAGHRRILAARDRLLGAGLDVVAPCPHHGPCPAVADGDWCHLAVRVARSSRHRLLKAGALGHEDEKFSYVTATRAPARPAPGRVVRHPHQRKGLITLRVCGADGELRDEPVPRSRRDSYRAARATRWGDPWPPDGPHVDPDVDAAR